MDLLTGGLAAVGAGFFTNPLEVIKTRMQLQGELMAKGQHAIHYRNVFHATYTIAKHDGFLALQNGLSPALVVQFVLNGIRLGSYQFMDTKGLLVDQNGEKVFHRRFLAAGTCAALGQVACTPFFIIKTHQQSQANSSIAVGHQHEKLGMMRSILKMYRKNGILGLYKNATPGIPRAFAAGSSQIITFEYTKQYFQRFDGIKDKPLLISFLGSMTGGVAISVATTPFELILTRLYNQPLDERGKGKIYSGYFDCIVKIYKAEGVSAFYKGVGPMYLRLGPHTVLSLMFWDELKLVQNKYFS